MTSNIPIKRSLISISQYKNKKTEGKLSSARRRNQRNFSDIIGEIDVSGQEEAFITFEDLRTKEDNGISDYLVPLEFNEQQRNSDIMDKDDILVKHIETIAENVERSHAELREEIRDREKRVTENQYKLEERLDQKFNRVFDELSQRENRLDNKFDKLQVDVRHKMNGVIVLGITIFLAIVALIWSMFSTVTNLISSLP